MLAGYGLFPSIYNLIFVRHPDLPFTDDLDAGLQMFKFGRKNRGKIASKIIVSIRSDDGLYFCGFLDVHLMVFFNYIIHIIAL